MNDISLLVKKSQDRDLNAFEVLVKIYQNKIFGLCYTYVNNYDDAQDMAQEVFTKAFFAIDSFRFESDFGTWLHRIATNICINYLKKKKRLVISSMEEFTTLENTLAYDQLAVARDNPEELLEGKETQLLIRSILMSLTEEHRIVLVLRDMEGYSYEEISELLDCSLGTVKSRINRARQVFKRLIINQLEVDGYEDGL